MIEIKSPYTYRIGEKTRLESTICDGVVNKEFKIWYEVDREYEDYLCTELADAFLLICLQRAAFMEQEIHIQGNVSPKLMHNTFGWHAPFLSCMYKKRKINVTSEQSHEVSYEGTAVGTGCSLGVDSLSTIYQHLSDSCIPEYRLTHLCLFNASHYGDIGQDNLDKAISEARKKTQKFADEVGLPLLVVNTNVSDIVEDLPLTPAQVFGYFTISCTLALQKLFKKYILASSFNAEYTKIEYSDFGRADSLCSPLLGNENVEVTVSDAFVKRTEKTRRISENPLTKKYLDVCVATQVANEKDGGNWYLQGRKHRNCGWCEKCRRTLITLELLGELPNYEEIFDLEKYYEYREMYAIKVVANAKSNIFYQEIYELMLEKGVPIPLTGKILQKIDMSNSKTFARLYGIYRRVKKTQVVKTDTKYL